MRISRAMGWSAAVGAVVATTSLGTYAVHADVAEAAPGCSGVTCEGFSPVTLGCDADAYTIAWTV